MDVTRKKSKLPPVRAIREALEEAEIPTKGAFDLPFLILTMILMSFGLVMVYSASYAASYYDYGGDSAYLFFRQSIFAVGGVLIMFCVSYINYDGPIFRLLSVGAMLVAVATLALVPFIGVNVKGATRWIDIGITNFQPSELAKLAMITCFAILMSHFKEKMRTFRYGVLPFAGMLLVICGLLYLQPHLSCIVLMCLIAVCMLFAGGIHWGWFGIGIPIGAAAMVLIINTMEHAQKRIAIWQNPFLDPRGDGYQAIQSLYAIGSGGLLGVGLGQSRQKHLYLPEQHNDFIFSIVCEELGFIGAIVLLILFAMLIIRGYWIAIHARDRFGTLLVVGVTTHLALQVILNLAVVTNVLPVTGVSLPFFSYGGTSLLLQLAEVGIVLSVSRQIPARKTG